MNKRPIRHDFRIGTIWNRSRVNIALDSSTSTTTSFSRQQTKPRACAWASVILAGKRDSCRHFTTSFCENDVVAKTSPRNVGDLVVLESQKGLAITDHSRQLSQVRRSQRVK